jgi:hypothetical protein
MLQPHRKEEDIMEAENLPPQQLRMDKQAISVQTARNLLTTQPNVGATKRNM